MMWFSTRIYQAPPTAELEPLEEGRIAQTDEVKWLLFVLSSYIFQKKEKKLFQLNLRFFFNYKNNIIF